MGTIQKINNISYYFLGEYHDLIAYSNCDKTIITYRKNTDKNVFLFSHTPLKVSEKLTHSFICNKRVSYFTQRWQHYYNKSGKDYLKETTVLFNVLQCPIMTETIKFVYFGNCL